MNPEKIDLQWFTEILSQYEIDQLLTAIDSEGNKISNFDSIESFEHYLLDRITIHEKPYGILNKDVSICKFFSDKNENLLEDIKKINEEQGYGNIKIPNTSITLINYSFCSKCRTIFSFNDIINYYKNPVQDPIFRNRANQYREDTRVYCNNCNTFFIPSLIIADGKPRNEVQMLCRAQTINEVEKYFVLDA